MADDRQSQPQAAVIARRSAVSLAEAIEHKRQKLLANANSRIADGDLHRVNPRPGRQQGATSLHRFPLLREPDFHATSRRRKLNRIREQIPHHLLQTSSIAPHGDVVCGGFAAPLNYADYCMIVTDNGFDALFAANRIAASVREKARTHPLRLAGLIGNRTSSRDLIDKYIETVPMPVLEVLPLIEDIRVSRVKGKTLFEMAESDPSLNYVCDYYLNIADQILAMPEGVVPNDTPDRELFSLLSDFYLNPVQPVVKKEEDELNLMMV